MALQIDQQTITHGIELALAPVFLLTAVAGMIGAVAGRLARIIDRARKLQDQVHQTVSNEFISHCRIELKHLHVRARLANACIALLTLCGLLIGTTILLLFLGETSTFQRSSWSVSSFLSGIVCFLLALLCFLTETFIATNTLDFKVPRHKAPNPNP